MQVMKSNALAQLIVQRIMELESTTNVEAIPLEHVEMLHERMSEQSPEPKNRANNWHLESEDYCRKEDGDEESDYSQPENGENGRDAQHEVRGLWSSSDLLAKEHSVEAMGCMDARQRPGAPASVAERAIHESLDVDQNVYFCDLSHANITYMCCETCMRMPSLHLALLCPRPAVCKRLVVMKFAARVHARGRTHKHTGLGFESRTPSKPRVLV